jgi:hypothetical protein
LNDAPSWWIGCRNFRAVAARAIERFRAAHSSFGWPSSKIRLNIQRLSEPKPERIAGYLDRAKTRQMLGRELRVEQSEPAGPKAREQMHERNL